MYPKFTCSCRVELSIGNEHGSAVGVYISPQIQILHTKRFFAHQLKWKPKYHSEVQRYCNICNYNIYMPCVFYTAGSHVCLWIDRRSHIWFLTGFFF